MSNIILKNILTPNKVLPHYFERYTLAQNELAPCSIEIHATASCNYRCVHCSYEERNASHNTLQEDLMLNLVNELAEVVKPRSVYFSGGGEPTTLKNWDKYISIIGKQKINTALISNGALISEAHAEALQNISYCAISVYGTTQNIYETITRANSFGKQFSVPNLYKKYNKSGIIGARCVISKENFTNIYEIYSKALDENFDYVIFIPAVDYENRSLFLSADEINTINKIVDTKIFNENLTNIQNMSLQNFSYYKKNNDIKFAETRCASNQYRFNAFINYDGNVFLCQPNIGKDEFAIGNIKQNSFSSIWNSNRHKEVLEKMDKEWKAGACANCRSISHTKIIEDYKNTKNNIPYTIVKDNFL